MMKVNFKSELLKNYPSLGVNEPWTKMMSSQIEKLYQMSFHGSKSIKCAVNGCFLELKDLMDLIHSVVRNWATICSVSGKGGGGGGSWVSTERGVRNLLAILLLKSSLLPVNLTSPPSEIPHSKTTKFLLLIFPDKREQKNNFYTSSISTFKSERGRLRFIIYRYDSIVSIVITWIRGRQAEKNLQLNTFSLNLISGL